MRIEEVNVARQADAAVDLGTGRSTGSAWAQRASVSFFLSTKE
jgi:hypothetical protein